jgi:kynurenine formamidase
MRAPLSLASGLLLTLAASGCAAPGAVPLAPDRVVDLSHPFGAETIFWPTEEGFVLEPGFAGHTEAGYWYAANRFRSAEHGGTHLDAPVHFHETGLAADAIPLARLVAPGVVVDTPAGDDPDHAVSTQDLLRFEAAHGRIPGGAIVLLHTGWGARWPDRARYLGTAARGPAAVAELRFPGLAEEAARWLVDERHIGAVGIDTASIDPGRSKRFESHRVLAARDVPIFENLAGLAELPARGFLVVALPMKIAGGSGAPLRAVAILGR